MSLRINGPSATDGAARAEPDKQLMSLDGEFLPLAGATTATCASDVRGRGGSPTRSQDRRRSTSVSAVRVVRREWKLCSTDRITLSNGENDQRSMTNVQTKTINPDVSNSLHPNQTKHKTKLSTSTTRYRETDNATLYVQGIGKRRRSANRCCN